MSEPLSTAASVVGIISLCLQLSHDIRTQIRTIVKAPAETKELATSLGLLAEALETLKSFLSANPALVNNSAGATPTNNITLAATATKCKELLDKINKRVQGLGGGVFTRVKESLVWYFDKELVTQTTAELYRFTELFGQCKTIEGMCVCYCVSYLVRSYLFRRAWLFKSTDRLKALAETQAFAIGQLRQSQVSAIRGLADDQKTAFEGQKTALENQKTTLENQTASFDKQDSQLIEIIKLLQDVSVLEDNVSQTRSMVNDLHRRTMGMCRLCCTRRCLIVRYRL